MDNGNGDDAITAPANSAVDLRLELLEKRDVTIERQVNVIRDTMATKGDMNAILARMESIAETQQRRIETIAQQQTKSAAPNWSAIGVAVAFLGLAGGVLYWPINTSVNDLKVGQALLAHDAISQDRYASDTLRIVTALKELHDDERQTEQTTIQQQRYNRDQDQLAVTINSLRANAVGRDEFKAVVEGRGAIIIDLAARVHRLEDAAMKH